LIDFVNGFDLLRTTDQFEQIAISCAFSFFQLLANCRPDYLVHQCRFAAAGNSCDHRKPADGETNIDIFQIIRSCATDFDPLLNVAQRPARSADGMPKWYFQAACRLGICIAFHVEQRAGCDDLSSVNSGARSKINDVIGASHRFLIMLDDN
jgi:hypothetical protein